LGRAKCGARIVNGEAVVSGVEAGNDLARLDGGADIDQALDHLARYAKSESRFDTWHDGTRHGDGTTAQVIADLHDAGGPHDGLGSLDGARGVGLPSHSG